MKNLCKTSGRIVFVLLLLIRASSVSAQTPMPVEGLNGVGINSAVMWSANGRPDPGYPDFYLKHFKPLEKFGFSNVVLVSCVDWIIEQPCKQPFQNRDGMISAVRLLLDNTKLHVTLSFKGYKLTKIEKKNIQVFQQRLEKEREVQDAFVAAWKGFAEEFKDVPQDRLSFALLNEPEFELPEPTNAKRKIWEAIASRAISAIRSVSPDRVIIYEGIAKSTVFRRWKKSGKLKYKFSTLIRKLPFEDIVYGIHTYEPEAFLQQANNRFGSWGRPYEKSYRRTVKANADSLVNWAKSTGVPVMVTETGCVSYVEGREGPANPDDCGKFATDIYNHYVARGIPIVWWGLEKEKTIYRRTEQDCSSYTDKYCDTWVPLSQEPDLSLFKGLRLNPK